MSGHFIFPATHCCSVRLYSFFKNLWGTGFPPPAMTEIHASLLLCYPVCCWSHLSIASACRMPPLELFCADLFYGFVFPFIPRMLLVCFSPRGAVIRLLRPLCSSTQHGHRATVTHLLGHTGRRCRRCSDVLASWSYHACTSGLSLLISLLVRRFSPASMDAWKF